MVESFYYEQIRSCIWRRSESERQKICLRSRRWSGSSTTDASWVASTLQADAPTRPTTSPCPCGCAATRSVSRPSLCLLRIVCILRPYNYIPVALNYQTPDEDMHIYKGFFLDNGGCGYVLKPEFLRHGSLTNVGLEWKLCSENFLILLLIVDVIKFNPQGPFPVEWKMQLTIKVHITDTKHNFELRDCNRTLWCCTAQPCTPSRACGQFRQARLLSLKAF